MGSVLAGILMFVSAYRGQSAIRDRKVELLRRFETIARMNDRIRNALQAIECATYATNPQATDAVRNAVDVIEGVLEEVLVDVHPVFLTARTFRTRDGEFSHNLRNFGFNSGLLCLVSLLGETMRMVSRTGALALMAVLGILLVFFFPARPRPV